MLNRIALTMLLAMLLAATPLAAHAQTPPTPAPPPPTAAVPLPPPDSPISQLVGLTLAVRACHVPATPEQVGRLAAAGAAMQAQAGLTDAQIDALAARFGTGIPATGCTRFKRDFPQLLQQAAAAED